MHSQQKRPQQDEARRLAQITGDWLMTNRRPDNGTLPLFPYSTISKGKFEGDVDGTAINLMRTTSVGEAMVRLYRDTGNEKYLDYACHIADKTMDHQLADGSFPYRVDPVTGRVVEQYTCHAIEFATLVDAIEPLRPDPKRAAAARRAVDWMLAHPVANHHWQAAFEDVREKPAYSNLENWSALYLIRHLCRHGDEDPSYVSTAEAVNRWVEDQFVVFGVDASIDVRCPTPLVIEQYACNWPMEVHSANWILALIELHKATGKKVYLDKAMAVGNAICASQSPNGELSTWGVDVRTGKPVNNQSNWYGCNAFGSEGLYALAAYVDALPKNPIVKKTD